MAENEKLNNVAVDNDVGTMEDVDAIMKKYDRESNTRISPQDSACPYGTVRHFPDRDEHVDQDGRACAPSALPRPGHHSRVYLLPHQEGLSEGQLHALVRYRHGGSRRVLFLLLPLKS